MSAMAQNDTSTGTCTEFQAYWEVLVATVPDDATGQDAFLEILNAGNLTEITEETRASALAYMEDWAANIENLDPSLIPASARLFHQDLAQDADGVSGLMEYSELPDLATMITFTPIGVYVLLMEEVDTPTSCQAA
jgi:hypothetical protein